MIEAIVAAIGVLTLLIVVARTVRIVPQARAGVVERLGRYSRTLTPGLVILVPVVDRVRQMIDLREQVVSFAAAAGDHRGQPRAQHRHRHLLPGDRRAVGHLRDRQLHPGDRAADRDDPAKPDRRDVAGADADLTRRDQRRAARGAGRGHGQVGHQGQPRRAEGDRSAPDDPGGDGEADARRPRQARGDPDRGGREAVSDPDGRGRAAEHDPARPGRAGVADAAGRGPGEGDRDRVQGDPRQRSRPQAAGLPVPADAAADRGRERAARCG